MIYIMFNILGKGLRHAYQFDFFSNSGLSDQILMEQLLEKIGR